MARHARKTQKTDLKKKKLKSKEKAWLKAKETIECG